MCADQVPWMSVAELGAAYRSGERSPVEVVRIMLERIARHDPVLRAYDVLTPDRAMAAAERAQADFAAGRDHGPMQGIPVGIKALCDMAGVRSSAGTMVMRERVPGHDSTVVARLEQAGAVPLGLLTMTEGASAVNHPATPQPRNPWDAEAWTGASSSGSGVALAAGLAHAAIGSDTAGSIRSPSHFCGVTGLKPTWGRVSCAGVFPLSATLDHVGPMTRDVDGVAAMLAAMAGADPADPAASREPVPEPAIARQIGGLRIGVDEFWITEGVDGELAAAVLAAAAELERAGALLVPVRAPDRADALRAGATILHADVALAHRELYPANRPLYGPHLAGIIEIGNRLSAVDLAEAHGLRRVWIGQMAELFERVDALVLPPTMAPAPPARLVQNLSPDFFDQAPRFRFTLPFTVSGQPCLTLPIGQASSGLPLGMQLVGRPFEEHVLFRLGAAWQSRTDWHRRHPDEREWRAA
ncbi:MAG: amidase [Pseudomonadota bacterium]|nr:amidase [Pseudomonadota bacterium]